MFDDLTPPFANPTALHFNSISAGGNNHGQDEERMHANQQRQSRLLYYGAGSPERTVGRRDQWRRGQLGGGQRREESAKIAKGRARVSQGQGECKRGEATTTRARTTHASSPPRRGRTPMSGNNRGPPPHVDFDIKIMSSGNIRIARSCRSTVPVPIPNLTKKRRGRRVPTKPATAPATGVGKSARTFTCTVDGCGKCFNCGEHLKHHIHSIHTDKKPHVCPVQKCGKTFNHHDNLCQHMRVHGKFSAPADSGMSEY